MNANAILNIGNAVANMTTAIIHAATGTPRTTPMLPVNAGQQFINNARPDGQLKALSGAGRNQGAKPQPRANVIKAKDADNKNDKKVDKPASKPESEPEQQKVKTKRRVKKRRRRRTKKRSNDFGATLLKIWKEFIAPSKPAKAKAPKSPQMPPQLR